MARNPYAGVGGGSDPYVNGDSYGTSTTNATSGADDYDPYGERYGTPPIPATSSARDRRGVRAGGYGGFYENSNGSAPALLPAIQQVQQPDGYGSGLENEPVPVRSPRRAGGSDQARRYRQDPGDAESSEGSRGPEYREYRRAQERQYQNGGETSGDLAVGRSRGNGRGGGDGTRQIEGE